MNAPQMYHLSRASVPSEWSAYQIHQHLWKGYERDEGAVQPFTFRRLAASHLEKGGEVTVLLQAHQAPNKCALKIRDEDSRTLIVPPAGQRIAFAVRVQAIVRSSGKAAGVRPHQRSIRDAGARDQWIIDRLMRAGLVVEDFWSRQDKVEEPVKDRVLITDATWVEGHARVQDPSALHQALSRGVGRGRSLGFGLLSLARA